MKLNTDKIKSEVQCWVPISLLKALGLTYTLTHSSTTDCSFLLYYTLVSPKQEYVSSVCSNIMTTNANWLEHIQQQSAALCLSPFFAPYTWQLYLNILASKVAYFVIQEAPSSAFLQSHFHRITILSFLDC